MKWIGFSFTGLVALALWKAQIQPWLGSVIYLAFVLGIMIVNLLYGICQETEWVRKQLRDIERLLPDIEPRHCSDCGQKLSRYDICCRKCYDPQRSWDANLANGLEPRTVQELEWQEEVTARRLAHLQGVPLFVARERAPEYLARRRKK